MRIDTNYKKQARVTNCLTEWDYKTNLLKNLSNISAISRDCRFCDFFLAEWARQHNHPPFPLSRAINHENVFLKAPLELAKFVGNCVPKFSSKPEKIKEPWFWFSFEVWLDIYIIISRRRKPGLILVLWISFNRETTYKC